MAERSGTGRKVLTALLVIALIVAIAVLLLLASAAVGARITEVPEAPLIEPEGPIIVCGGSETTITARARGADGFRWTVEGAGGLSAFTGSAVIYTAPNRPGATAVVSVTAFNVGGVSPPTNLQITIAEVDEDS